MAPTESKSFLSFFGIWLVDRVNVFFRIRRYIKMVSERWGVLALCLSLCLGVAIFRAVTSPNIYQATSKINVAPKVITPGASSAVILDEINSFYDTHLNYLNNATVRARVQERLRDYKPAKQPFRVTPAAIKTKGAFVIVVESTEFDYAQRFARLWADEFVRFKKELDGGAVADQAKQTVEEVKDYQRKSDQTKRATWDFQRTNDIASAKETSDAAQARLDRLEEQYQAIKTERKRLEIKTAQDIATDPELLPRISAANGGRDPSAKNGDGDSVDPLRRFQGASQYGQLKIAQRNREAEKKRALLTLFPAHPYLVRLEDDLQKVNQEIATQLDLLEEERVARINSLKADEKSYPPLIAELRKNVFDSRQIQSEYERLKAEEGRVQSTLDNLYRRLESLNSTPDNESLKVIEAGVGSPIPVKPNRVKIILVGLFLGVAAGLSLIYLLGQLDDRLELAEDIEAALEQPVLGQVPEVDLRSLKHDKVVMSKLEEHSMFAEALRGVRSAVMLGGSPSSRQVLVVSSAVPGDGKTTFTANFAVTLAIAGHKVLLVDADLRRGNIHGYFEGQREPGFADVLLGNEHWSDVLSQTSFSTLKVISSGKLPSNPGELLVSPIARQFIDEVKHSFDYVVFDCPPLTAIDDTFSLVPLVDGVIFVVRSGQTSMRFAKTALATAKQRGAQILGIVINGIRPDNPYYYYKNYYHSCYNQAQGTTPPASSPPMPAVKMAAPRKRKFASIEAEAIALKGDLPSEQELQAREVAKTKLFRSRSAVVSTESENV